MKKYIYIPTNNDAGMKRYHPEVIFVDSEFGTGKLKEFRGNSDQKELESGRFRFYFASRCIEYNDRLWEHCKKYIALQIANSEQIEKIEHDLLHIAKETYK